MARLKQRAKAPLDVGSFVLIAALGLSCNSCLYARILYFNAPTLAAPSYFDNRVVRASPNPKPLPRSKRPFAFPLTLAEQEDYDSFDRLLEQNDTAAFLAIKDGQIVYERYFGDVTERTLLPSFSMSKTYAAALVGCAVDDGFIESMQDGVVRYLPELAARPGYPAVKLDHLLRMTSGIDFDEESIAGAEFYYSTDLRGRMYDYEVVKPPGRTYLYGSVNIQLLWDVLSRSLDDETVSEYFEERLWDPLGAEWDASWSLDSEAQGVEKFFGGFNATLRDHARIGLLFLHKGSFQGERVVSRGFIDYSLSPDPIAGVVKTSDGDVRRSKYQWFITLDGNAYFAKGYHGQYVFVVPKDNVVLVRFGEGYGNVDWTSFFVRIARAL